MQPKVHNPYFIVTYYRRGRLDLYRTVKNRAQVYGRWYFEYLCRWVETGRRPRIIHSIPTGN